MKMLKFTNMSNQQLLDMPIYINRDKILSVFEESDGGSLRTIIFGENTRWIVEESLSEVIKIINGEDQ